MTETTEQNLSLQKVLTTHIENYLNEMKGQDITALYDMVIEQVEQPLFQATIEHCKYNQSKAAQVLGLSRGTLRTKLKKHFNDKYCGSREQ